ncbi:hypothetical protein EVAR_38139_1 [Eumeta japonica]|uniref:Uncharacterized protein n=1 Tax=Eumeta variegata TaxID=151549 RepID=A0A4C1YLL3_EUMVA|nr:hypothetical protein EVAR_38139_1 [Eumeta japonica]
MHLKFVKNRYLSYLSAAASTTLGLVTPHLTLVGIDASLYKTLGLVKYIQIKANVTESVHNVRVASYVRYRAFDVISTVNNYKAPAQHDALTYFKRAQSRLIRRKASFDACAAKSDANGIARGRERRCDWRRTIVGAGASAEAAIVTTNMS